MHNQTEHHQDPAEVTQLALEKEAVDLGVAKYRQILATEGVANLTPGQRLLKAALTSGAEAIRKWIEESKAGLASRNAGVVYFIDQFSPEMLAWVTGRSILSSFGDTAQLTEVALRIAGTLEESDVLDQIAAKSSRLRDKLAKQLDRYRNTQNRLVFLRRGAEFVEVKPIQWDKAVRLRVGTTLAQHFCESTGLAAIETVRTGKHESTIVRPTEAVRKWLETENARCELLMPLAMPMVCRPRDWTHPFNGGYLTKALKRPLVKTRSRGYLAELRQWDMSHVYAAVNALQGTQWAVNRFIYDTVRLNWEAGRAIGGLPSRLDVEQPAKSWQEGETPAPEVLKRWKAEAAKVHQANGRNHAKRLQVVQKLWVAEKMVGLGNQFHFVYNADWRGRLYPAAAGLNPQGDDLAKALLRFAVPVKLGDNGAYWLAVHGANCFGVDKVSFDERVKWVEEHAHGIEHSGRLPAETDFWQRADAPLQFLAFCREWAELTDWVDSGGEQGEFLSYLPVSFDGTCNGLQNFSALLKDPVGGMVTGLVPTDRPSDVYSAVAAEANRIAAGTDSDVARRWAGKWTRGLAKRNTMTVPYGVTLFGMRDQILQEFREIEQAGNPQGLSLQLEDALFVAQTNYDAIGNTVTAARRAMDWLQAAAKVAASDGLPVKWVAPSGFLVNQDYRNTVGIEADFRVSGRRYRLMLEEESKELNTRKQASGISPNFVHSLDAAHLVRTVLHCAADGIEDFAMVHDSFGVHAGHADMLNRNLRAAFVEQYSEDQLAKFRDTLLEQLPEEKRQEIPPLPEQGALDLAGVLTSDYFFA